MITYACPNWTLIEKAALVASMNREFRDVQLPFDGKVRARIAPPECGGFVTIAPHIPASETASALLESLCDALYDYTARSFGKPTLRELLPRRYDGQRTARQEEEDELS